MAATVTAAGSGSPSVGLYPLSQEPGAFKVELFRYNELNQLVKATNENGTSEYAYKPDGLRLSKTVNGETTEHVWDGSNIVMELDGDGTVTDRYIRGIGLIESDNFGYYLFNAHGDTVQLTDSTGDVTKDYQYDAFGVELAPDDGDGNPWRYSAEYFDEETGTIYLRARVYDSSTGRFGAEDTHWNIGNMIYGDDSSENSAPDIYAIRQSANLYVYCMNNPIIFTDPFGDDIRWITAEKSAYGLGHSSTIVQDGNGDWYYFYWGKDHALLEKLPKSFVVEGINYDINPLGDLGNFNLWLEKGMNLGLDSNGKPINYVGTHAYTHSIYVEGDFTEGFDYYKELVEAYNSVGKGKNIDYHTLLNNCLIQASHGFFVSSGSWNQRTKFPSVSVGASDIKLTPNATHRRLSDIYGSSSFKKP